MPAGGHVRFAPGDLGEGATDVQRHRLAAVLLLPGDGSTEGPVDLADPGPVPETLEVPAVPAR